MTRRALFAGALLTLALSCLATYVANRKPSQVMFPNIAAGNSYSSSTGLHFLYFIVDDACKAIIEIPVPPLTADDLAANTPTPDIRLYCPLVDNRALFVVKIDGKVIGLFELLENSTFSGHWNGAEMAILEGQLYRMDTSGALTAPEDSVAAFRRQAKHAPTLGKPR